MDVLMSSAGLVFDGQLKLTASLTECVAQRLTIRLKTHVDSWWLDLDYGVDYFEDVFGKGKSKTGLDALFRSIITQDEYVESIKSFTSSIVGRNYSCSFAVSVIGDTTEYATVSLLLTESGIQLADQSGNSLSF
jgi:hypothetical protein